MNYFFKRVSLLLVLSFVASFHTSAESLLKPMSYYNDELIPYVQESAEIFSTWDYVQVISIMHPKVATTENQQWIIDSLDLFSKLGVLKVLGKPKLISLTSGSNKLLGKYVEIVYRLIGFYQNGEALVDIKVIDNNDETKILHFGVHFSSKFVEEYGE
jgi:hypothetical protein